MPKFSVKKPFTVLVGVVLALVLGVVSIVQMPTDLLPTISLPYLMVLTPYPGASPEQVESELTAPLEAALGTINGVENVTSTSSENYSVVMLEFAEKTNMDSAMVKATTKLNQLADSLPERAQTPTIMEISADMMATQYLAVDYAGMDIYELSDYVQEKVIPALERVDGVARVDPIGLVEKSVRVRLNQEKIDKVNDRVLAQVSDRLAEAQKQLDEAQAALDEGQEKIQAGKNQLAYGQAQLNAQEKSMAQQLNDMIDTVSEKIPELEDRLADLEYELDQAAADLNNLGQRLGELTDALHTGEGDTFSALHTVIAENAPDWYAANAYRLPYSVDEILNDESKLSALIEGLEAARAGLSVQSQQNQALDAEIAILEGELQAADWRVQELEAALDAAYRAGEPAYDEETGEEIPGIPDEALTADLESKLYQALQDREDVQYRLDALRAERAETSGPNTDALSAIISLLRQAKSLIDKLDGADDTFYQLSQELDRLNEYRGQLESTLAGLKNNPNSASLGSSAAKLILSGMQAQLAVGQMQLAGGENQMLSGQAQLDAARAEYEAAREEALKNANLDQLLNMQTLAQIIGAQNFSMPAGYIRDGEDKFLLKVGENYESVEELSGALLCSMEGIGDVRLSDVADVEIVDNAGESYAKVGGNQAVLLAVYKGSTASTSDVSEGCNQRSAKLMEADENLHLTPIMDQGEYIRLIVSSVMSNLIQGALLAVIVLVFFLKDVRPTLVVAVSIPLSVLAALVVMYFSGITLNMVSLSGLALGIGMLVDNSIVVIENIYRLRSRGIPSARAAVQGTRQVAGSIISSTITTICVFLPMIFAGGLVRQLMMDLALTITFSLLASLVVAMTVVPCAGNTLLKTTKEKQHPWFDKLLRGYEKTLRFCLKKKVIPLTLAIVLMLGCVWQVTRMGVVMIPNISSNQLSVTVTVPEDTAKEEACAAADAVMEAAMSIDGIETAGAMSGGAGALMGGGLMGGGEGDFLSFSFFVVLNEEGGRHQKAVEEALLEKTKDLNCTVTVSGNAMADASALLGSGVEVEIYGQNLDTLLDLSQQVMERLQNVEGIENLSNGQEEGDTVAKIVVDKDEAMRLGLTVAQVYMEIAKALTTDATSTTLTVGNDSYVVNIVDTTKTPELSRIMDFEFQTQTMDENGQPRKEIHTLGEFARREDAEGVASIGRENLARFMKVTSSTAEGYNTALIAREAQKRLEGLEVPEGYSVAIAGETTQVNQMLWQMAGMMALALLLIYLVMVAQFQSLLSPFIVLFTIPLAFTGGLLALIIAGETISMMSLMGFLILMGVVVNNGIVFVDYTNQLRMGGMPRDEALVATGKTRMRPILMTTMTTVLSMITMLFATDPGSEMGRGMAIVIVGGLTYATLMTLLIVPVMYDILFRKKPVNIDVGDEGMDDLPDDAAEFLAQLEQNAEPAQE